MTDPMSRAYSAAKVILDEQTAGRDRRLLARIGKADVLVVGGCYDRVEDVLSLLEIKHEIVSPAELDAIELRNQQLVIVNCPGKLSREGVLKVRDYVEQGGFLLTTDWALKNVVEPAFPGYLQYNGRPTGDEVVGIRLEDDWQGLLAGVLHAGADPQWWLEGQSYPIRVLGRRRVKILLASRELGERYGEPAIAVAFKYGKGEVLHMISHLYLQRTELRSQRHSAAWNTYAAEAGVASIDAKTARQFEGLAAGEVESAHTSLRMLQVILLKSSKSRKKKS
jgi:hypothetical protein